MKLLSSEKITQKVHRIAIEILERNWQEKELFIIGINNAGMVLAQLINAFLKQEAKELKVHLGNIILNPKNPVEQQIKVQEGTPKFTNKVVIVVDDVANTGRTLLYAIKPFLDLIPKKIQTAVLVDRKHKSFPVCVDYVGLSLATTMREHIEVKFGKTLAESEVVLN